MYSILAGKPPNIRSYMVYIYASDNSINVWFGQTYSLASVSYECLPNTSRSVALQSLVNVWDVKFIERTYNLL